MPRTIQAPYLAALLVLAAVWPLRAAPNDWAEGTAGTDGATRDYYNRAARLPWENFLGDWRDARDQPQGDRPFAEATVADDDTARTVHWDVTALIRQWLAGEHQNQGFFLRGEGGTIVFSSREHPAAAQRPKLVIRGEKGNVTLEADADTFLDASTYRSQGTADELRVSGRPLNALLRFDLERAREVGPVAEATLELFTTAQYGEATIGVFRCAQGHNEPPAPPRLGLAANYPGDRGIGDDPAVVFFADFEAEDWAARWSHAAPRETIDTVAADPSRRFEPLQGRALRARIPIGSHTALNTLYRFQRETGAEPEEIFFRYYLRLADDWDQSVEGGKMPGISGTYGVAGWGGRPSDGTNGWSARGAFHRTIPEDNPLGGLHPMGTYCYHADMQGRYGSTWLWTRGYRGFLENNRWYSVEQQLRLNTPGEQDGVLRAWIDGRLAFEKTDIRFRREEELKIEQVWMNVYHGGSRPSPRDQHLYIDNVVIATQYIGPMEPEDGLAAVSSRRRTPAGQRASAAGLTMARGRRAHGALPPGGRD